MGCNVLLEHLHGLVVLTYRNKELGMLLKIKKGFWVDDVPGAFGGWRGFCHRYKLWRAPWRCHRGRVSRLDGLRSGVNIRIFSKLRRVLRPPRVVGMGYQIVGIVVTCIAVLGTQRNRIAPSLYGQPGIAARPGPYPGQQARYQGQQSQQRVNNSGRKALALDQGKSLLQFGHTGLIGSGFGTQDGHLGFERTHAFVVSLCRFGCRVHSLPGRCCFEPL